MKARAAAFDRRTTETQIKGRLTIDGQGRYDVSTGSIHRKAMIVNTVESLKADPTPHEVPVLLGPDPSAKRADSFRLFNIYFIFADSQPTGLADGGIASFFPKKGAGPLRAKAAGGVVANMSRAGGEDRLAHLLQCLFRNVAGLGFKSLAPRDIKELLE